MAYFIFLNIFFIVTFFHRKKQVIEIFLFLLVLFFTAFSYKNGWDLNTYESWFLYINKYGLSGLEYIYEQEGIEGGYLFFNYIVSLFSSYFEIFVFIFGLLTCLLYYVGCRKLGLNFGLLILVFFCSSYTRLELSTLRQGIAVAIFFYSLSFLLNKQIYKYIMLCILAITFHRSAILLLFVYPFVTTKYRTSTLLVVSLCGFVMLFFRAADFFVDILSWGLSFLPENSFLDLLKYKINFYLLQENNPFTLQRIILILAFIFFSIYRVNSRLYDFALSLMFIQVAFNTLFSFLPNLFLVRVEYYFMFGWMMIVVIWYEKIKSTNAINVLYSSLFLCVFLNVKLLLLFKYESERMVYFPYENALLFHLSEKPGTVKSIENVEKAAGMRSNGL